MLPHRFPFAFAERIGEDRIVLSVSAGSWWTRHGELPTTLALEAMAQGAAVLLRATGAPADAPPEALYLAGIDSARFDDELARQPLSAGDRLEVRARLRIRLGPLLRIEAELRRGDRLLVEAAFTATAPPREPVPRPGVAGALDRSSTGGRASGAGPGTSTPHP